MLAAAIDIGQSAGRLDVALESWTSLHASLSGMRKRLFAASVYPALLMFVAVVSLTMTAWQLIPHYERAFAVFSDEPPVWLGAVAWIHRHLWYCVALFLLAMLMPALVWWWRRRGVTALGVYREEASRCYVQSHVARLAVLALNSGRPVSELVRALERAAGRPGLPGSVGEVDEVVQAPNEEVTQQVLGRETTMTLAALEGGIVTPEQCQTLLESIATQTKRQGDVQAQKAARWLPMLVALIVGAAVATTYVVLIYGPWLMLFHQIASPTEK
jgi:type II secretory pathway component PulF